MRIISQSREIDVPYEQMTLIIEDYIDAVCITAYPVALARIPHMRSDLLILGYFKDWKNAVNEMQMIRMKYAEGWKVYEIRKEGI